MLRPLVMLASMLAAGCVSLAGYLSSGFASGLGDAVMDNRDLAMVRLPI
jgi:hypothetical protein